MTRWWAMVLWRVSPRGWTMARHSMAWRRLVTRWWRSSVMVGRWIAASGSGAGSRPIPVGSAPLLKDSDVSSLALRKKRDKNLVFIKMFIKSKEQLNPNAPGTYLMWAELSPIQSMQCILHVLSAEKFHHTLAIALHVCKTHVSCLTHMIFQILPAPSWW